MCGITGILLKDPERVGPVGRIQVQMLQARDQRRAVEIEQPAPGLVDVADQMPV